MTIGLPNWFETAKGTILVDANGNVISETNPLSVIQSVSEQATELNSESIVIRYLVNGTNNDMAVDGSSSEVEFSAIPPAGKKWVVARLLLYFSTGTAFDELGFGNLAALTNGIQLSANGVSFVNWQDNIDINTTMFDADGKALYTKDDKSMSGRFSFFKFASSGNGIVVRSPNGFSATVRDDLSSLTVFRMRIEGEQFDD
ncbi:MAG: hypothetical protein ACYSW7_12290 [Planctomycetota bacterium]|jgi:hypothetical protein